MRILALGGVGLLLIGIFLGSLIARLDKDTRREIREPRQRTAMAPQGGQAGQMPENMPPAMAEAMRKQGLNATPGAPANQMGQGGQQMPEGRPGAAMANMDEATMAQVGELMRKMQENPRDVDTLFQLASIFMDMQDWDAAISFLDRGLVASPSSARIMGLLGISHFNKGEYELAVRYFERLLTVEPNNAGAHYNLGMIHTNFLKKPDVARQYLETLQTLPTANAQLRQEAQQLLNSLPAPGQAAAPEAPATPGEAPQAPAAHEPEAVESTGPATETETPQHNASAGGDS